jgi:hypothetical protein
MPFQPAKRSFDLDYHREPPRIRCVGDGPRWTTSLIAGNYVEQSGMSAVELAQQGVFYGTAEAAAPVCFSRNAALSSDQYPALP